LDCVKPAILMKRIISSAALVTLNCGARDNQLVVIDPASATSEVREPIKTWGYLHAGRSVQSPQRCWSHKISQSPEFLRGRV
jgi:hypothetical protein